MTAAPSVGTQTASPGGTGKRERTKAVNREAILVAARRVFSDLGYGAASVRDIVRETDLATGRRKPCWRARSAPARRSLASACR